MPFSFGHLHIYNTADTIFYLRDISKEDNLVTKNVHRRVNIVVEVNKMT